ncbi:hypothetical protein MSAN_00960000 [Mycena sanguinolenta]|uniref:Uncharacterized protein n=1 Tax=Mycena sanguinolenta TaxID=230812 RepID=A0A8H6YYF1_9AGAR|nr:hypothetical protein MSAN_00960000 [Mycena sanguinolenta]
MRFHLFSLIALFALLFTFAAANPASNENDRQSTGITMSNLFRPWTWTLPDFTPRPRELDAAAQHVRRHGPHRRAISHP